MGSSEEVTAQRAATATATATVTETDQLQ